MDYSSSSKMNLSKVYIVTEGKQKKSKRKKKHKKCSSSDSWKSDIEDQNSRNTASTVTQTVKLPLLVSGSVVSTFIDANSATDLSTSPLSSGSTYKQTSNGYCHDQAVDSSSLAQFDNISMKQKLPSKSKSQRKNSGGKQTNKDKVDFKVTSTNVAPSLSSSASTLNINNSRQLCSNSINTNNNNESLRWESALEDAEEEQERIRVYKMNRRKRYLADAQAKGLSWAVSYNVSSAFQVCDNIGLTSLRASSSSYTDYRPVKTLGIFQVHSKAGIAAVET